jgi:hypothetical protein
MYSWITNYGSGLNTFFGYETISGNSAFPKSGTAIGNVDQLAGFTGHSHYDGSLCYAPLGTSYAQWVWQNNNDYIYTNGAYSLTAPAINDVAVFSSEIAFYYDGNWGSATYPRIFSKMDSSSGEFTLYLDASGGADTGNLILQRECTDGSIDTWMTTTTKLTAGNWYEVQVLWVCGCGPSSPPYSAPVIHINTVTQYVAHNQIGGADWVFDGAGNLVIGNRDGSLGLGECMQGSLVIFRWYPYNASSLFASDYASDSQQWPLTASSISISAPASAIQSQNFTISGTLSYASGGISGATISLLNADTMGVITTTTTDGSGNYSFSISSSTLGSSDFKTSFAGNSTYSSSISAEVTVTISSGIIYDVDGAIVTNCQVEFIGSSFPSSGTTITNVGQASGENGTAYQNDYTLVAAGDAGWVFPNNPSDMITVPANAVLDDMQAVTYEFLVYYAGGSGNLYSKGDASNLNYPLMSIQFNSTSNCLQVNKVASTGTRWNTWFTTTTPVTAGNWYFIQITWNVGTTEGTANPICYINNVNQTISQALTNTGSWTTDAGGIICIGNEYPAANPSQFYGTLVVARIHNVILTSGAGSQLEGNYNASKWRAPTIKNAYVNVDVPGAAAALITLSKIRTDAKLNVSSIVSNATAVSSVVSRADAKINVATITSTAAPVTCIPGLGHSITVDVPGAVAAPITPSAFTTGITSPETDSLAASTEAGSLSNVTVTIAEADSLAPSENVLSNTSIAETDALIASETPNVALEADEVSTLTPIEAPSTVATLASTEIDTLIPIEALTIEEDITIGETDALSEVEQSGVGGNYEYVNASEDIILLNLETQALSATAEADETQVLTPDEEVIDEADLTEIDTIIPIEAPAGEVDVGETTLISSTTETIDTEAYYSPVIHETVVLTPIEATGTDSGIVASVIVNEFITLKPLELTTPQIPVLVAEPEILVTFEEILPEVVIDYADSDTLDITESISIEAKFSPLQGLVESDALNPLETSTFASTLSINESTKLAPSETAHLTLAEVEYITHNEVIYLDAEDSTLNDPVVLIQTPHGPATIDALEVQINTTESNKLNSIEVADINPNVYHAPPPLVDYVLEVRKKDGKNWDLVGVLENRVAPELQCEVGAADQLTFNLPLSDPKSLLFNASNTRGLEVWYYGRDSKLKQVFTITGGGKTEGYRDYGGNPGGSGSTLGTGSGDWLYVTAIGPEAYLTMYYVADYTATQKYVSSILNAICGEIIDDGYITAILVDPALNKLIDIDLSWENLQSALGNIIQQTGGYMRVLVNSNNPSSRVLYLSSEVASDIFPINLGGVTADSVGVCSWGPNRLDLFARGENSSIYHKYWNGTSWSGWATLGGTTDSAPTACSWGPNRIDVFVRGTDNILYQKYWNGAWSTWIPLGGTLTSAPAAASWGLNRIDVVARGTNNQLYHIYWNGINWSTWGTLGGDCTSDPAIVSWGENRLDVFVRGTTMELYHTRWDGSTWSTWENLGGYLTTGPGAASWGENRIDVFAGGEDNELEWQYWGGDVGTPIHQQGIAFDGTYYYYTTDSTIYKLDASYNVIASNANAATQCGGDHLGGLGIHSGTIYQFCTTDETPQVMMVGLFNTSDLSFIRNVDLTKVAGNPPTWSTYNIGGVGVDAANNELVAIHFGDAGSLSVVAPKVFKFNLSTFAYLGYITGTGDLGIYYQGICPYDGVYYYTVDNSSNANSPTHLLGGVYMMNPDGTGQTMIIPASVFNNAVSDLAWSGEIESLSVTDAGIVVLCGGYIFTFSLEPPYTLQSVTPGLQELTPVWSGWESLGGYVQSSPAACSWGYGRIDVFLEGPDGAVYQMIYQEDVWQLKKKNSLTKHGRVDCPKCPKAVRKEAAERKEAAGDVEPQNVWSNWNALDVDQIQPPVPIIKYDVFPSMGDVINNDLGDSAYDGVAFNNGFTQLQCGVGAWVFNAPQDVTWTNNIQITSGPDITGLADMTLSMCVYIDANQTAVNNPRLFSKQQENGAFELIYDTFNQALILRRYTTNNDYDEWRSAQNSVPIGDWYYIQLIWQSSVSPETESPPVIIVDNEQLTLVNTEAGTGWWSPDYSNNLYIGNSYLLDGSGDFVGIMSFFSLYGAAIVDPTDDFNTNAWRRDPADVDAQLVYNFFPQIVTSEVASQ